MNTYQPPRIARLLLEYFGCSPNNDAVVGDLDERYRQRRSSLWYWKQVVMAILVSFFQDVWNNKLLAMRAVVAGMVVKAICLLAYARTYAFPDKRIFFNGFEVPVVVAVSAVLAIMCSGWVVARLGKCHWRAMALLYVAIELIAVSLDVRGVFVPYSSWMFPLTRVIAAVFLRLGLVGGIAFAPMTALVITIVSILIGAGFFRKSQTGDAHTLSRAI
jgi:hypothetical protein